MVGDPQTQDLYFPSVFVSLLVWLARLTMIETAAVRVCPSKPYQNYGGKPGFLGAKLPSNPEARKLLSITCHNKGSPDFINCVHEFKNYRRVFLEFWIPPTEGS